jgi:predicted lipoprotein
VVAWSSVRITAWQAWEYADTFDIGPATDRRSNTYIAYRVAPGRVDIALAGTPPADADTARNRTASNQRGYGAVDHLLVDDPTAYNPARCTYLTSLMALIAEESAAVADAWAGDGRTETLDMDPNGVIDDLVNMQISFLESSSRTYSDGNPPTPAEAVEIPQAVAGLGQIYEAGLDSLLDQKLADTIGDEVAAVLAVPVNDAGDAVEALRATITTEVVSALDVTIGFSENDGDSSS